MRVEWKRSKPWLAVPCVAVVLALAVYDNFSGAASRTVGEHARTHSTVGVAQVARSVSPAGDSLVSAFYDSLAVLESRIPKGAIDVSQLADRLGRDPEAIVAFVSDSIGYDHYDGILRGSFGTLVSRSGNSCDQALLLAELFKESGISSQFRLALADSTLNAKLVERALDSPSDTSSVLVTGGTLRAKVDAHLARITSSVPEFSRALSSAVEDMPSISTYCWLKAEIAGRAREVDPITGVEGIGRLPMLRTGELAAALHHRVILRVILKVREKDEVNDVVLNSLTLTSDTIGFEPITLTLVPDRADLLDSLSVAPEPRRILSELDTFYPVIGWRGDNRVEKGFNLDGDVVEPGGPLDGGGVKDLGREMEDILGGGRIAGVGARDETEPAAGGATKFAGVRLELSVESPAGPVETARRNLVDETVAKLDPASGARALRVIQERQILAPPFAASSWYVLHRLIDFYDRNRSAVEALVGTEPQTPNASRPGIARYPFQLLALAAAQDQIARALSLGQRTLLFRSRPALSS
jgi:hypothetical protein